MPLATFYHLHDTAVAKLSQFYLNSNKNFKEPILFIHYFVVINLHKNSINELKNLFGNDTDSTI